MKKVVLLTFLWIMQGHMTAQVEDHMRDVLETAAQTVEIELLGHASLRLQFGSLLVYVDPVMEFYKADDFGRVDLILVTHSHRDHYEAGLIEKLKKPAARVFTAKDCRGGPTTDQVLNQGEETAYGDLLVKAVMAYNVRHTRENGEPFHPKGVGNGYLLTYGGKRIYVAGDTEDIPEMSELAGLDAAFLPANLPYTMDADMFMNAVEMLRPGRVYPYHYKFGKSVLSDVLPRLKEKKVPYKIAGDSV